ncbi:hypothetical protein LX36DRAFT_670059 [Colletotrichum falcatum]|nr:hypothetical protein LX36DRAFT_670059 [Colletotrichum falcatum]
MMFPRALQAQRKNSLLCGAKTFDPAPRRWHRQVASSPVDRPIKNQEELRKGKPSFPEHHSDRPICYPSYGYIANSGRQSYVRRRSLACQATAAGHHRLPSIDVEAGNLKAGAHCINPADNATGGVADNAGASLCHADPELPTTRWGSLAASMEKLTSSRYGSIKNHLSSIHPVEKKLIPRLLSTAQAGSRTCRWGPVKVSTRYM